MSIPIPNYTVPTLTGQESQCISTIDRILELNTPHQHLAQKKEGEQLSLVFNVNKKKKARIQNYIPLNYVSISFPVWNSNTPREPVSGVTLTGLHKHSIASLTCSLVMPLCAFRSLSLIKSNQIAANSVTAASPARNLLRLSQSPSHYFCKLSGSLCSPSLQKTSTTFYSVHFSGSEAISTFLL